MCRPVTCRVCGKTTWAGCGQHVAQIKASVPKAQWCNNKHTPEEIAAATPKGFFAKLFGG
ncbi:hypothetical protein [Propioniciclava tarda]|uniref:Uncharacterized protein n=1 Tax=Propioniciclava tarda TaxID=433330 RepID=A0A4Q9KR51_PROTD|nr:hypothetical protein [Propioniciclava tarda]TBT96419.1 hypothetical protein ET996_01870 [Propioniciclava tarda]SMO37739.1 hypothetical protein SAMN06266982_101374 [Propioniciclava tarda]HQA31841.1 hypothetical protein [Propioniciclava tarda]HQD61954.1 hypothetical protein [Propioniciclava tarda]